MPSSARVIVVGAGLVGLATALALQRRARVVVVEAAREVAAHQSGHNSNVIHSGLYYKPGTRKARLCVEGREALYRFCETRQIPHERCGKIVVATTREEAARLEGLLARGASNGLRGLRLIGPDEMASFEPHVRGCAAIHVPETGIVSFPAVARTLARLVEERGGEIRLGARVVGARVRSSEVALETTAGPVVGDGLVGCAGLHADRVARLCGLRPEVTIMPFRGEYYEIVPERRHLVRNLVYPTPDPRLPFLGVHFTRTVDGAIEAGPNAVLALKREGYRLGQVSAADLLEMARFPGAWRLLARHWRSAAAEYRRSVSKRAFVAALQRLIPDVRPDDVTRAGAGVRAMAVDARGEMVDDFSFVREGRMVHVISAPSPAATASIGIGAEIADAALDQFGMDA